AEAEGSGKRRSWSGPGLHSLLRRLWVMRTFSTHSFTVARSALPACSAVWTGVNPQVLSIETMPVDANFGDRSPMSRAMLSGRQGFQVIRIYTPGMTAPMVDHDVIGQVTVEDQPNCSRCRPRSSVWPCDPCSTGVFALLRPTGVRRPKVNLTQDPSY